ncbi:MAG TPA: nucleotidyltransferase [Kofleriaceae bacterium]|nr:nucleotidyltransferase [Kofleriaceae bacterium]
MQLGKDFRDLLELLNRHQVRYLVVGGFAVAVHGAPRYTKDLDLWLEVSRENADRIVAVLDEFGFASLGLQADDFLDPDVVVQLGYEPNRVDFLTKLTGVEFAEAYPARSTITINGIEVPVIGRASLIANKRALGRPHDLEDAKDISK